MRPQPRIISRFFIVNLYYRSWGARIVDCGLRIAEGLSHRGAEAQRRARKDKGHPVLICSVALWLISATRNLRQACAIAVVLPLIPCSACLTIQRSTVWLL